MYKDIATIRARHIVAGGHWFDEGTMRFLNSRVSSIIYPCERGAYFVSSERFDDASPRRYSVRFVDSSDPLTIETAGEFGEYGTMAAAHRAAKKFAKNGHDNQ